jgi:hypothetical protein
MIDLDYPGPRGINSNVGQQGTPWRDVSETTQLEEALWGPRKSPGLCKRRFGVSFEGLAHFELVGADEEG